MSLQNVEIVRLLLDAWRGGTPALALGYMREDVEIDTSTRPDGKVWSGREGVSAAMADWFDVWDEHRLRFGELVEAADGRVALLWSESGRAKRSRAPLSQDGVTVFTVVDGLVSAILVSVDTDRVLATLGLATGSD
jgi:ketosteroid isomerase-like protein